MADKDNAGLAGAYYRPPVPPRCTSHGIARDRHSCCSSCLCSIFKLLFCIVLIVGIVGLAVWLIARPNRLVVYAENASLTRFEITQDGRYLAYNFSLVLSVRNPNHIGLYYDRLEAAAFYNGSRFGYDYGIKPFFQDQKNTSVLRPGFNGQQAVAVESVFDAYGKDKEDGRFDIQVKIYTKVGLKVWLVKTNKYSPDFTCDLRLPVISANGVGAAGFSRTECSVDYF